MLKPTDQWIHWIIDISTQKASIGVVVKKTGKRLVACEENTDLLLQERGSALKNNFELKIGP
jgi:hypothetical protein